MQNGMMHSYHRITGLILCQFCGILIPPFKSGKTRRRLARRLVGR